MSSRSTPISQLRTMDDNLSEDENSQLVQEVLDEVELSKQQVVQQLPQMMHQPQIIHQPQMVQQQPQMIQQKMGPVENMHANNYMEQKQIEHFQNKTDSFLGFNMSDLKLTVVVFILFVLLNLLGVSSLIGRMLPFSVTDDGTSTVMGVITRALVSMLIFLIAKKLM